MKDGILPEEKLARPLLISGFNKSFIVVLILSIILGITSGYFLSNNRSKFASIQAPVGQEAKLPQQDTRTFRDFAEGTIRLKPEPKDSEEYTEGTHLLERDGASPVTLTSSVVDLSKYEGKKVKIFGETQKALTSGWLMDVGKIEER